MQGKKINIISWVKTTPDVKADEQFLSSTGFNQVITSEKPVSEYPQGIVFRTMKKQSKIQIGVG